MWGLPLVLSLLSKLPGLLTGPVTQAITGINVGQVLTNVLSILNTALKFVIKHWQLSLVVLLTVGNIVGFTGWELTHQALKAEQAAHQADVQSYKQAQKSATAQAEVVKAQLTQESKVKADEANQNYSTLYAKYRANLLRYEATQGTTDKSGSSEQTGVSQGPDGSGGSSEFLKITAYDAGVCAENTAKLMAAHDWAINYGKSTDATP